MPDQLIKPVAILRTPLGEKFGVPRQSGLAPDLKCRLEFFPEYSSREAFRELEGFSHLWLIWGFSLVEPGKWRPTVRPPRLGGNKKVGVFASRSPFRPNPLGLSCVRLERIGFSGGRAVLEVSGADLADGTPVYDVKPYIPYADSIPQAIGGWADSAPESGLSVSVPDSVASRLSPEDLAALREILAQDPRPPYQSDPQRVYTFGFAGLQISFRVSGDSLTVLDQPEY